jgi:hypothetical protein
MRNTSTILATAILMCSRILLCSSVHAAPADAVDMRKTIADGMQKTLDRMLDTPCRGKVYLNASATRGILILEMMADLLRRSHTRSVAHRSTRIETGLPGTLITIRQ